MNDLQVLYLSKKDVEAVDVPMPDIIIALETMFGEKGRGNVEMPPKPGIHTQKDAFIHAMPGYIPSMAVAGIKWVSGYPDNPQKGLPYISGLIIINDPDTGLPLAIMDALWITAKRTGAATAVAAKYLARKNSTRVGIIACGVQGRSNLEALSCVFDIDKVKAFDTDMDAATAYKEEMSQALDLDVEIVGHPKEAVKGMDIIVTSGPILLDPSPAIEADWLDEGAFACPLDFDSYWQGGALQQADKLATDDMDQLAYYREVGYFRSTPEPFADLGHIVSGKKPGREAESERIISINLGLALNDMATAALVYGCARERGIGTVLPL